MRERERGKALWPHKAVAAGSRRYGLVLIAPATRRKFYAIYMERCDQKPARA
jgi:hypothetical protein